MRASGRPDSPLAFALSLAIVAAAIAPAPARAQDFANVRIRTVPVADGLAMLMGRGGNIAVSYGPDGVVLIDDQYAPLTERIRAAVSELSSEPIRFVLNTHWHGDHTGGNENLGRAGAVIVAHDRVRARMATEQVQALLQRTLPASPAAALPVVTFSDALSLHLNGTRLRALHVAPAHTDGDSLVHFPDLDVLHMGDVYFNGFYPFIDVDSGGSVDGVIAAVERGLALAGDGTRIIPGHGPLSDRRGLEAYGAMLRDLRDAVAALIAQGKSADEVVAAAPTAAHDAEWGDGFLDPERFTRILHASLSR